MSLEPLGSKSVLDFSMFILVRDSIRELIHYVITSQFPLAKVLERESTGKQMTTKNSTKYTGIKKFTT